MYPLIPLGLFETHRNVGNWTSQKSNDYGYYDPSVRFSLSSHLLLGCHYNFLVRLSTNQIAKFWKVLYKVCSKYCFTAINLSDKHIIQRFENCEVLSNQTSADRTNRMEIAVKNSESLDTQRAKYFSDYRC